LLEYTYSIDFYDKPNYDHIRFQLKKILLDLNQIPQAPFNWKVRYDLKATNMQDAVSSNNNSAVGLLQDAFEFDDLDKLS